MKHLIRDGVRLAYEESGSGSPPIVFVHGWTCDRTYFTPQQEHFVKRHRVVATDLRGHGDSDKPEGAYPISQFADDIAWLCGELGVKKPIVVGHSMGGMTALELAVRHPDTPAAIVVCDSPMAMPEALRANLVEVSKQFQGPDWRKVHRAFISDALFHPADDPKRKSRILAQMTSAPDHVTLGCWQGIVGADMDGALAKVKVPFLYLAAEPPLADLAKLRALSPHVVIGQTVGAGHFHQLEVPDQVNAMLERFLTISHLTA
jgi:pimeloyl-ACP methyl ester carboxylesterase